MTTRCKGHAGILQIVTGEKILEVTLRNRVYNPHVLPLDAPCWLSTSGVSCLLASPVRLSRQTSGR